MKMKALTELDGPASEHAGADRPYKIYKSNKTNPTSEPRSTHPHDPSPTPRADYDTRGCAALMAAVLRRMSTTEALSLCEVPGIE